MSDSEFENHLAEKWPDGPKRLPEKWMDPDFNNPSQPVVGVSWFEAQAYCGWLLAQTGRPYRLPTTAEWIAFAQGPDARAFAWGDEFDPTRCNCASARIKRPSPVGVFVEGDTPTGLADVTGNVHEWMGAEPGDDDLSSLSVRGGSWASVDHDVATRHVTTATPDRRGTDTGLRLVLASDVELSLLHTASPSRARDAA